MLTYIATVVGIVGALIAYFQWRTAQQKVAVDLFEKRYEIYGDLRRIVSEFLTTAEFPDAAQRAFQAAQSLARFYFGAEVDEYLEKARRDLLTGAFFNRYAGSQGSGNLDNHLARMDRIGKFYADLDHMFIPYMRMDQRMPLWWWSRFRRKSFINKMLIVLLVFFSLMFLLSLKPIIFGK
jgi:hypothetical protein